MAKIVLVVPLQKAINTARLVKKPVIVNRGGRTFQSMRWVRPMDGSDGAGQSAKVDPENVRGSKYGYGIHRINTGDVLSFKADGGIVTGAVIDDSHEQGVVVQTEDGRKFNVKWRDITRLHQNTPKKTAETLVTDATTETLPDEVLDPGTFAAADWGRQYDNPDETADSILDEMEKSYPGVREEISKTEQRLKSLEQTISFYRTEGEGAAAVYTPERLELHDRILQNIFSPEKIANATPNGDLRPVFIMLGGRGGSGKSWLKGKVYDESRAIVLDADEIKGQLDEYEGWNAAQVHEESSDILEKALAEARKHGLNVVLDATMKTTKSAIKKVEYFKERGYSIEAHYMYCPRQEAAKRAVKRFMGKTKRYVPVDVVLSNTSNEATFDEVRKQADAWSFRNNMKAGSSGPMLVSENGKRRFSELLKSLYERIVKGLYSKSRGRMMPMKEREDARRFDEYDNGPVTPDDQLAPDVLEGIEKRAIIVERIRREKQAAASKDIKSE